MQLIIPKHSWVVKQELLNIPVFGRCLKTVRSIAVDRANNRSVTQILEEGERKIEEYCNLIGQGGLLPTIPITSGIYS